MALANGDDWRRSAKTHVVLFQVAGTSAGAEQGLHFVERTYPYLYSYSVGIRRLDALV